MAQTPTTSMQGPQSRVWGFTHSDVRLEVWSSMWSLGFRLAGLGLGFGYTQLRIFFGLSLGLQGLHLCFHPGSDSHRVGYSSVSSHDLQLASKQSAGKLRCRGSQVEYAAFNKATSDRMQRTFDTWFGDCLTRWWAPCFFFAPPIT